MSEMKVTVDRKGYSRRNVTRMIRWAAAVLLLALFAWIDLSPARAGASLPATRCGDGSAPDYGLNYDLLQEHWTVGWPGYVSEDTVIAVDEVLDRLDEDAIAQTMILIEPEEQVGNRVNCAVHFLRYMKLGLPSGERKDNGFVFLIVVEPNDIDVHYGVGLGLPALTAHELTDINRAAEEAYQRTGSLDQALLTLVQEFDTVARDNYAPLVSAAPPSETINLPDLPSGPLGIVTLFCLVCIGILILIFLVWAFVQMARRGWITYTPSGSGYRGTSFPSRMGGSSPRRRGGSGSGRSGRGN